MRLLILLFLSFISFSTLASIEAGIKGHQPGDVIAVRTDDQIAAWCDFDKQIVVTQFNVLCIFKEQNPRDRPKTFE